MNHPPANDDPQYPEAWGSDVYPRYGQLSAGSPDQSSYYPPAQPGSSSAVEENLAVLLAQEKVNRRFAFAGLMCGCFSGLPLILALLIGLPHTAWVIGAWLGPPIAVGGIVLSVLGLRSSDKRTAKQGLLVSIMMFVLMHR